MPWGRPSQLRQSPPWTFLPESAKWMLAAPRATALPWNLPRIIPRTKTPFRSTITRHKPCLLITPSLPRLKNLAGTTRKVGAIRIVAIATSVALGLKAPPRSLGSIRPRPRLKTIVIVAATGQRIRKIKTWAKPFVTIITKRGILLTSAPTITSQKTSIGLGNLYVDDWC